MLRFIGDLLNLLLERSIISIHLMLRFIGNLWLVNTSNKHFNTSHVKVYPPRSSQYCERAVNFNTSHVKVYQVGL